MVKPNFFIIGAIKSGSTSLAYYLNLHPQVYMPGLWEFQYFADDLTYINGKPCLNQAQYLRYFEYSARYPRRGEKSVFYLFSETAPTNIHAFNPGAKLVCILRHPIDVIWSLYRYNVVNLEEDLIPLERALEAEADRSLGHRIPESASILQNLFYRAVVDFAPQVNRYQKMFGRDNVLVILLDDLTRAPDPTYQKVLSFLDLPPWHLASYPVQNENSDDALVGARRFLWHHKRLQHFVDSKSLALLRNATRRIMRKIEGPRPWAYFDPRLRAQLQQQMNGKIQELGQVIGRDLSQWTETAG